MGRGGTGMSDEKKYVGTGAEIARFDLGDVGDLVIKDDGDPDYYVRFRIEADDGSEYGIESRCRQYRTSEGDDTFETALTSDESSQQPESIDFSKYGSNIFKCDDCNRSWPGKRNQTPDGPNDICPDCYDG
jgi:hypothetical protein